MPATRHLLVCWLARFLRRRKIFFCSSTGSSSMLDGSGSCMHARNLFFEARLGAYCAMMQYANRNSFCFSGLAFFLPRRKELPTSSS
jgi:hypothetical protein